MTTNHGHPTRIEPRLQVVEKLLQPLDPLAAEYIAPGLRQVFVRGPVGDADQAVGVRHAVPELIRRSRGLVARPQLLADLDMAITDLRPKLLGGVGRARCLAGIGQKALELISLRDDSRPGCVARRRA